MSSQIRAIRLAAPPAKWSFCLTRLSRLDPAQRPTAAEASVNANVLRGWGGLNCLDIGIPHIIYIYIYIYAHICIYIYIYVHI